jgi:DNA-binding LacI/PurR family transcriptional regulator
VTDDEEKSLYRLEDLAEIAKVSISTVSRALNDSPLVSERTKKRIMALAQSNNYDGRLKDKVYSETVDKTISMVIPAPQGRDTRLSDPFTLDIIGGVGDALKERNCDLLISHLTLTDYNSAAGLVSGGRCDGLIILGQSDMHKQLNELQRHNVPFVVWGANLPDQQYCSVGSDNLQGGRRATNHLIRMGRKKVVFIGDVEGPEVQLRFEGYKQALEQNGIEFDQSLVQPAHFYPESAMEAIEVLVERGIDFDGVVAASDMIAIGAMRGLTNCGKSVPTEVSVMGYDDVLVAAYASPALSTIRQDVTKAGRLMVNKLLRMIEGETVQSSTLPTDLIIRESCGS